ncbi:MAG: GIY-YIG nuclease family protein, partial [Acidobacteriota bacterium]
SRSRNLYVGITNNLPGRTARHREQLPNTHTAHYNIHRLVYFEYFRYVRSAIAREKQLKCFTRAEKITLIESRNPTWDDLYPTLHQTWTPQYNAPALNETGTQRFFARAPQPCDGQNLLDILDSTGDNPPLPGDEL